MAKLSASRARDSWLIASTLPLPQGDLPSVKIDGTRLIRGSDLREYVERFGLWLGPPPRSDHLTCLRIMRSERFIDPPTIRVRASRLFWSESGSA